MQMTNRFVTLVAIAIVLPLIAHCGSSSASASRRPTTGSWTIGWDSGELQTQIGDRNNNKKSWC
jgi:hypothetical protein